MPERDENHYRADLLFLPASEGEVFTYNADVLDEVQIVLAERIVSDDPLPGEGVTDFGGLHPDLGMESSADLFLKHLEQGDIGFLGSEDDDPYMVSVTRVVMESESSAADEGSFQDIMERLSAVEVEDPLDDSWQDGQEEPVAWRVWISQEACRDPDTAAAIIIEFLSTSSAEPPVFEVVHPDDPEWIDYLPPELLEPQLRCEIPDADWIGIPDLDTEIGILKHIGAGVDMPDALLKEIDEGHCAESPTQNSVRITRKPEAASEEPDE